MQRSQVEREIYDEICGGGSGAGVMKGLRMYILLLLSLIAAVIF